MLMTVLSHPFHSAIVAQNTNKALYFDFCGTLSQMASIELPNQNNTDFESHYNVGDRLGSYVKSFLKPGYRSEREN